MLNKIFLQGRLVADPELRHTQNGAAVRLPSAWRWTGTSRTGKPGSGKADFINVVAWRQTGEFVSRFLTKGRLAVVEGKLQTRDYTDRDGNRRYATEVVADNVYFGDSRRDGEGGRHLPPRLAGAAATVPPPATTATPSGGGYTAAPAVDQFADLTDDDGELLF